MMLVSLWLASTSVWAKGAGHRHALLAGGPGDAITHARKAPSMATEFVVSTADHAKPIAPNARALIGGREFTARCPKDALWAKIARAHADGTLTAGKTPDEDAQKDMAAFVAAMFAPADTEAIEEMMNDPACDEVSLGSISGVISALVAYWSPFVEKHLNTLHGDQSNRSQRRTLAKLPAAKANTGKKTAVGAKTASAKTPRRTPPGVRA
ncbi:hypothetical protein ACMATS_05880 [Streptoverticillium reticulum]|uniref:hypothetical protein n=1 Tax=Streptoverticillium reticulum TaxID=1433415 RepID=UPI0039BF3529